MTNRIETPTAPAAAPVSLPKRPAFEQSAINIDPDFYVPAGGARGNSYVRALRILFPKAS